MQAMFIALFAAALLFFSLFVNAAVDWFRYALRSEWPPHMSLLAGAFWFALFLVSFAGAGFYLYEREREEGRIMERIGIYEAILRRRRSPRGASHGSYQTSEEAKPIRRAESTSESE